MVMQSVRWNFTSLIPIFLGSFSDDTIFLIHVKQIEEKIYQHLYVFKCESKDIPNNRNERTAYWIEISQEYLF